MMTFNPFFFVLFSIFSVGLLIGGVWAYRKFFCKRFTNEDGSVYYAEVVDEYKPLINAEIDV
tara:strand:+ start:2636 stop:2821 length:186 start_codon:yes stop_codon:yes gene_type:complete